MSNEIRMTQATFDALSEKARRSKASDGTAAPAGWREVPHVPAPVKPPIASRHSGGMNKTEADFLRNVLHGQARYEAVTLKLEGGSRYTPDFVAREGGVTTFYEVKGAYRLGSEGRAHTAFYEAASQFPWCRFVWAVKKGKVWTVKRLEPLTGTAD